MGYTGYDRYSTYMPRGRAASRAAWLRSRRAQQVYEAALKNKYKPNNKSIEIIGVRDPALTHITTDSVPGTLTQTTFDTTSRADSAQILLTNATGASKVIIAAWIRGKPVTRLSDGARPQQTGFGAAGGLKPGASARGGYLHDKFVDYERIAQDGDITFETGNNFVVTADQVNKLADYYWKLNRTKKHIYTLSLVGFQSWFEPGEWYTLQIGGVGEAEYIDSTVECFDVRCSLSAGSAPSTSVSFREVEESWKFDSNEVARQISAGDFSRRPSQNVVTVAAQYYSGYADYYCDGTADQEEINDAITYLNQAGGGTVHLAKGNYNTTSAITLADGIRLEGEGKASLIVKNCNDYAIAAIGTSTTSITDISLIALGVTRSSSDTNVIPLVYFTYADNAGTDSLFVDGGYDDGISILKSTNIKLGGMFSIVNCDGTGLLVSDSNTVLANSLYINGCGNGYECITDIATEGVDRGDCESATPPSISPGTTNWGTYASFTQSSTVAHSGTYSYRLTLAGIGTPTQLGLPTSASVTNMHGFTSGLYNFSSWVYLATGMTGVVANVRYSTDGSSWASITDTKTVSTLRKWELISIPFTVTSSWTGIDFYYQWLGSTSSNYTYIDDISITKLNTDDSGCQLTNSCVSGCVVNGVYVSNNRALIQNNQVNGNGEKGIVIGGGYYNIVMGNRSYNNGDDIGNDNTNQDNFYDAGTDTQWAG